MNIFTKEINYPNNSNLKQVIIYFTEQGKDIIISNTLVDKNTGEVLGFIGGRPDDR